MIVPTRVLSNGGVLAGNNLMSGSTGGARCYVRPPLTAPAKEFKAVNNSISKVIQVMVAKPEDSV